MNYIFALYNWNDEDSKTYHYCPDCGCELAVKEVDQKPRAFCANCGFIQYRNPFPAVSVLAMDKDRVLLVKRAAEPLEGKWALPSGYIEYNEDFVSAGIREVRDETGLEVKLSHILHVESGFVAPEFHFLTVYLLGAVTGGELRSSDDSASAQWFPAKGPLPEMAFDSDVRLIRLHSEGKLKGLKLEDPREQ